MFFHCSENLTEPNVKFQLTENQQTRYVIVMSLGNYISQGLDYHYLAIHLF